MCIPVVFVAVELVVCRDARVESGAAEEVACNFGLVCEVIPQLERETSVVQSPLIKWFLKVWMARSAALTR